MLNYFILFLVLIYIIYIIKTNRGDCKMAVIQVY